MSEEGLRSGWLSLGIHRPVGMAMVVLAVTVFGIVSLGKLPVDLLPPIDYPSLVVRTTYAGAAPEDVEERVTERLEDALATVGKLVRMRSASRAESSEVFLEFEWGSNLPFLVQDVRERLDRVFLPQGVERPLILRYDPSLDPILRVALSGGSDLVRLRDTAERDIERALEGLSGVAAVKVRGGLEDEIQVRVDPQRVAWFKVSMQEVLQRLREENLNVPGGTLEEGEVEYVVRTLNEFRTLEEMEELPITVRGDRFIKLRDMATVERTHKDRDVILRVAGEEAVEIDIYREAGANIVEAARLAKERLFGSPTQQQYWAKPAAERDSDPFLRERMGDFIAQKLPSDMKLTLLSDQAEFVKSSIQEVRQAGLIGGILAILVCFFFLLRLAPTFIVALSIPVSIVATFGPMYLGGVSLNVMSLGGLALGIGMLVDNTIVVLESITRCREDGDPPLQAAARGVREVGGAVTASTLTTVAVFAPIVFVEGVAGQTFGDQALTVVASLSISLAIALFFIPGLAARIDRVAPLPAAGPEVAHIGFFRGFHHPRRKSTWILSVVLVLLGVAALGMSGQAYQQAIQENLRQGLGIPGEKPELLPEQLPRVAWPGLAGALCLLLGLWWVLEYAFLLLGRAVFHVLRLAYLLVLVVLRAAWLLFSAVCWPFCKLTSSGVTALQRTYPVFLRAALRAPAAVLLGALGMAVLATQAAKTLGRELLPEVLQSELTAEVIFPAGFPLESTDRIAQDLEARLRQIPGVVETAVVSGRDRESISPEEEGTHTARILVRTEGGGRARDVELEAERQVRTVLASEPAITRFDVRRPTLLALNAPLEVEILGEDLDEVRQFARKVETALEDLPGITDLRTSLRRGNPEVLIRLDRERLAEYGLQLADVARRLRIAVEGEISSTFPGSTDRVDIRVRADLSMLKHVEQARDLFVNPADERPIPLGAVAEFSIADGPSEIRHVNKRRAGVLSATTAGLDLGGVTDQVTAAIAALPRPPGVDVQIGGQKAEMDASLGSLFFALGLAVFLVYAVMAAQFESLLQPLLIMFTVPLAAIGAVLALWLTDTPISVVALLGAVILAGIVVNNAIVLVDRINRNRRAGLPLDDAIIEAGQTRLRPILMTTVSTVLGMLPLTGWLAGVPGFGGTEGMELRAPMALVVIAGLVSSTVLTLVVIPTGYRLLGRLQRREGAGA